MATFNIDASLAELQAEFDADQILGYRGATVDPEPRSAYSQETDPTTSPRAGRVAEARFVIDEYGDPNSPEAGKAYTRLGLRDPDRDGDADVIAARTDVNTGVLGVATALATPTTELGASLFDGTATAASFKFTEAIAAPAAGSSRTLTVRNVTKGLNMFQFVISGAIAANTETPIPVLGAAANRVTALDDEISLVETVAGAGVAHSAGSANATVTQAA